jgi:hypothetical protein
MSGTLLVLQAPWTHKRFHCIVLLTFMPLVLPDLPTACRQATTSNAVMYLIAGGRAVVPS